MPCFIYASAYATVLTWNPTQRLLLVVVLTTIVRYLENQIHLD